MSTSPKDQDALLFNATPPSPRARTPGELLFEFPRGAAVIRCELRSSELGVEAQFLTDGELRLSRFFGSWLSTTLTPRAMAVQWAETQRQRLEALEEK